jgi:hypothetical protein
MWETAEPVLSGGISLAGSVLFVEFKRNPLRMRPCQTFIRPHHMLRYLSEIPEILDLYIGAGAAKHTRTCRQQANMALTTRQDVAVISGITIVSRSRKKDGLKFITGKRWD